MLLAYAFEIIISFPVLAVLPLIIGLLSVLFLEKKNHRLAIIIYYIMIAFSVIPFLGVIWLIIWIITWNTGFAIVLPSIVVVFVVAQLILMARFPRKANARKIIGLTLMATPLITVLLLYLVAWISGIYIALV